MRSFSNFVFAIAILLCIALTTIVAATENKKKDILRRLIQQKQNEKQQHQQPQVDVGSVEQQNLVGAPTRPLSTIPFITDRSKLNIFPRDTNQYKFGSSTKALDIPTRHMWGWGDSPTGAALDGYCGETCFQAALIYYGSWVSAERVRYADGDAELLVGVNDEKAAKNLDLNFATYNEFKSTGQDYLNNFVKSNIDNGYPVVLGFYILEKGGDAEYDHIMEIVGYELNSDGKTVVGIYFNDWYTSEVRYISKFLSDGSSNVRFISSRKNCNVNTNTQNPYDYCIPSSYQYSIALQGLTVNNAAGIYTRAIDYLFYEPDWGREDQRHEAPVPMNFTLVINGNLQNNGKYTVLRFDSPSSLVDGVDPQHSSFTWRYDFTYTGATNGETILTNVTTLSSDGEYWWVTVPEF